MASIEIHPKYKKMLKKLDNLKEQLSVIIEDKEYLIYHKAVYLKTEYINKVGKLEYELFKLECNISRIKRKIDMVQAAINLQESINEAEIDEELDKEYEEYIEELKRMSKDMELANYLNNCETLTGEEVSVLKKLYRKLAKRLHPDLNPSMTKEQKALWVKVNDAYESTDIEMLKVLYEFTMEYEPLESYDDVNMIEELEAKVEFLKKKIMDMLLEIEKIQEKFPLNMIEFLKDEEEVYKKQKQLKESIQGGRVILKELEGYLSMIMTDTGGILN